MGRSIECRSNQDAVREIGRRVRKLPRKGNVPDGFAVIRVIADVQGGEPHLDLASFNRGVIPQGNKT